MQSNKWGNHCWEFCHTISFNYPISPLNSDKNAYKMFYENLKNIIPCNICKCSYAFFYDNFPIDNYLDDRHGVVYWVYTIHNIVNLKLGNNVVILKDVILKYENNRARCGNINTKDNDIISDCQKTIEWNDEMEMFYKRTINKYQQITIEKISSLIKNNCEHKDVLKIISNLQ
jgi:hypothetical protein